MEERDPYFINDWFGCHRPLLSGVIRRFDPQSLRPEVVLNPMQAAVYRKSGIRKVNRDASDTI
jgi:hypothetical protein